MAQVLFTYNARPVLKWAGGKSQLLAELLKYVPAHWRAYHEPFVGGGALFFELANENRLTKSFLSDINQSLIDVYIGLRDCPSEVIHILQQHRHHRDYYYRIRALWPENLSLPDRAARIIYLNKTCYNGLYRENRSGQFNVPFGKYKNPTICDTPNLRAASVVLHDVDISCRHFSSVLGIAQPDDFVYFDPPYHPLSTTSNFTAYAKDGFGESEQVRLQEVFRELTKGGVKVMLSNSDTPFIHELYADYRIYKVYATRAINSKAEARGKVSEVIVCNYPTTQSD